MKFQNQIGELEECLLQKNSRTSLEKAVWNCRFEGRELAQQLFSN